MQPKDYAAGWLPQKIFLGSLVVALILKLIVPLRFLGAGTGRETGAMFGWLIVAAAIGIAFWADLALKAANAPVSPDKPARALATGGPYRFSRNPIYLSLALVLFGLGFVADSFWPFLALIISVLAVQKLAIEPEEADLAENFGEAYRDYANAVRRWL
ncbi:MULTISPECIES: isoprenylcysteine carboxylmethyltransferase family protein [unclassified Beijerinckia]|uniref:methyltransferase family protein n=1 Tax=unclassified Beijerinckia TaxID=2638183 RepID=UPI00089538DB|nr:MULTISPECIES: isoprenylcysteine carboxylmethyltransferase family protein [unclassified Beijerinckia]MDH7794483.1 protein-S-isoprenylcysteine O-methyltransferase Ste14 [Beijerinckia sp. GAS462]SEB63912.1 Protein-S-isoprenylcysteine O-methyltransferase Ste14 [Beijerinckia sp. 28-YEA-48]